MKHNFAILYVLYPNAGQGGAYRAASEMAAAYSFFCTTIIFEPMQHFCRLTIFKNGEIAQKNDYFLTHDFFENLLASFKIRLVHIHLLKFMTENLFQFYQNLAKKKISYVVTLHDYFVMCPTSILFYNHRFCDTDKTNCAACLSKMYLHTYPFEQKKISSIDAWQNFWRNFLKQAKKIFVPSNDTKERLKKNFPELNFTIFENPELISPEIFLREEKNYEAKKNLRVGLIGALTEVKGGQKLIELANFAQKQNAAVDFILFGSLQEDVMKNFSNKNLPRNLKILGAYQEREIYRLIAKEQIDFFLFLPLLAETYSYTLSIPVRAKIPVMAFDLGAVGERIKRHRWGKVISPQSSCEKILQNILQFDFENFKNNLEIENTSFPELENFYGDALKIFDEEKISDEGKNFDAAEINLTQLKNLTWQEYAVLRNWNCFKNFSSAQKIFYLLAHVDPKEILQRIHEEFLQNGWRAALQKIKISLKK